MSGHLPCTATLSMHRPTHFNVKVPLIGGTCNERTLLPGPEGVRSRQVLLYTENNNYFMCDGIDPDSNINNNICVDSMYNRPTESTFKEHFKFKQKGHSNFSLVHFNCRSMASNLDKLKDSVQGLDFHFDVIAVSETWLKDNATNSSYSLDGYSSFQCSRLNKTGGGVALYINEMLQPNYLPNKSKCIDNCAEIVTVEVTLANGKKF